MRILLLLRGAPCSGKSTWVEKNGLKPYTLSSDEIRLMFQSPVIDAEGKKKISQENDEAVWKTLFRILRGRMQRGDFTVIDATNSRTAELNRYKEMCAEYRYRAYCVDFTDIPIGETKRRNMEREPFRRVPESVIDTMYARFASQKVPSGIKVIKPEELDTVWIRLRDFSYYKKVHHIGDIHGCNTVLQRYLAENGGIRDDEMYIFVGDYIDRGMENVEVIRFLFSVMERNNVLLLEGNHEKNLWLWANDKEYQDKEFGLMTMPALETAGISKKDMRNLYRRFGQCAYYEYDGRIYLVTHGGLSTVPENLTLMATEQMIEGSGRFEEAGMAAEAFQETTPDNVFQIHGHRNIRQTKILTDGRVFNLEGQVEYGGCLRCLQVGHDGVCPVEIRNEVCRSMEAEAQQQVPVKNTGDDVLTALRSNQYIVEKRFGNISSFNYSDEAFFGKVWDSQTVKARGLYLDTVKGKVAARAYDKFFNIGECEETKLGRLQRRLKFPLNVYVKENGFLGIVSYQEYEDSLLTACKSTVDSRFAGWFREMLEGQFSAEAREALKRYVKEQDVSFIFECVDMEHDPHVIEYPEDRLVLLDIVRNSMECKKYSYENMCAVADRFGFKHKEKVYTLSDWQMFFDWYQDVRKEGYEYQGRKIEGFVIEDSTGYMTKLKLSYYNFWKQMRAVSHEVAKKGLISNTASLTTPIANEFYGWLKEMYDDGKLKGMPKDICSLRKRFMQERRYKGK